MHVVGYHEDKEIDFYGVITNIFELEYVKGNRVALLKCKWFNLANKSGMQIDDYFTSINVSKFWYESDPFVLVSQAKQV